LQKKILAISGSTRKDSSNESILQTIKEIYSEILDVQLFNDIAGLPHFDPDPYPEKLPLSVITFLELVEQADGVIICSPEYVFSLPAVLKNALEWMVATTIFSDKPVALIIAAGSGEKALEQLILIMNTLQAKIGNNATLLMRGARSKINSVGKITDAKTLEEIDRLIQSFMSTIA
jgi:chromate reductase